MRIVVSIFCLPYEIDELENTINQLKKSSYYLSGANEWVLDITLSLSSELTNWNKSSIQKSFFEHKLLKISSMCDWCAKYIKTSTTINGCVSQRRETLLKHSDADYFLWLDTDIIFDDRTLSYLEKAITATKDITPYSIITPEIVRVWDNSWDCIVNEQFLDKPIDYQKTNDPFKDSGVKGDISIETVLNSRSPQSRFKFAGGWFTCISGKLLNKIGVPESFGHYGYEDTFIMVGSEKLIRNSQLDIQQFKIKNLVVCENYKYRTNHHYLNNLSAYDRREEFKKVAHDAWNDEISKI